MRIPAALKEDSMLTLRKSTTHAAYLAAAMISLFPSAAKANCGMAAGIKAGVAAPKGNLPVLPLAPSGDAATTSSITGLWLAAFTSGGQLVDTGFDQWNGDGTEILNDTPPPSTGNVCLGIWKKTGANTMQLFHPSWTFDSNGNLSGTAIIQEVITLDATGNHYQGTFTLDEFDLSGNLLFHSAGNVNAKRIAVP